MLAIEQVIKIMHISLFYLNSVLFKFCIVRSMARGVI